MNISKEDRWAILKSILDGEKMHIDIFQPKTKYGIYMYTINFYTEKSDVGITIKRPIFMEKDECIKLILREITNLASYEFKDRILSANANNGIEFFGFENE